MSGLRLGPAPRLRLYTSLGQYGRVGRDVLLGRQTAGDSVAELETRLARSLGVAYAVAMPLARAGIYHVVRSLIRPGQRVLLSPYTIADVVNMVVCAGAVPVFCDVERATCNIDPAEIERQIDRDAGAVLATHFYGLACDMPRIAAICARHGVPLIEDAAQAFGGRLAGRPLGTFGDAGIFSFGMYKNVNAFFGGMVVTPRSDLRDRLAGALRDLPFQPIPGYLRKVTSAAVTDTVTFPPLFGALFFRLFREAFVRRIDAVNNRLKIDVDPKLRRRMPDAYLCRMTPLQARLILAQLDRVEADMAARIEAARRYHEGLRDIPELILPPLRADGSHIYWHFPIQFDDRHALVAYAMRHGRDIAESHHRNCADLPCFAEYARDCPNARAVARTLIYLPTYPGYGPAEVERTVRVIRSFFGKTAA
ncbi:MAG TPA: DegT/DnrJ/EryC1/StrS family aminotransferase [Stellaceae bacterium]|nr:DegT/DnrJ/EryC1/StrS family aminotransferase [Stellaceae bacterium]